MRGTISGLVAAVLSVIPFRSEGRIFTDRQGKTVDAEIVGIESGAVVLKIPSGQELRVPVGQFGDADQEFLKTWKPGADSAGDGKAVGEPSEPAAAATASVIWDYDAKPSNSLGLEEAKFRIWIPEIGDPLRGMIALVPGSNGDGRDAAGSGEWQALARELGFGLIACFYRDSKGGSSGYCYADDGSGKLLLDALDECAKAHERPELQKVPLLLWGFSAGGQFNYNFARWKPERTLAFVVNKGGFYYDREAKPATRSIPALLFLGMNDTTERMQNITRLFEDSRSRGALWALCAEPGVGHDVAKSAGITRAFFKKVVDLRLPKAIGLSSDQPVRLKEADGWLGDNQKFETGSFGSFNGNKRKASWLPDQEIADLWKQIVN